MQFDSAEREEEVLRGGIYNFDNKPLIVKGWDLEIDFSKMNYSQCIYR